jgi:tetratricopeptide (TPR) repeat protein
MNTSLNGGLNGELSGTAAGDGAAGDLTLKSQHRRKMQLAHEAGLLHKAGRTEDLERCLRELLEIDPKNAQALYNLGIIAFRRDERATAERYIRQAIAADADYVDAFQALGDIYYEGRHLMSAMDIYEKGLQRIPTRLPLLTCMLRACVILRSAHRSEAVARRILNIDDRDPGALNYLPWALLLGNGDLDEARGYLLKLLEVDPESTAGISQLELLEERAGNAEESARWRARLEELMKQSWSKTRQAAESFMTLDRSDRAADVVRDYLVSNPEDPQAHRFLAVTLMQDGDFVGGQKILDEVLAIVPDRPNLQMVHCLNSFRLNDLETFYKFHYTRWTRDGAEAIWELPVPEWDGKPIKDGKLVVQCEQGIGDYVMFAVCFPGLPALAKDVIVKAMGRMMGLFQRSFPHMQIIPENQLPPDTPIEAVAARCVAGDLPYLLGGDIEHLPGKGGMLVANPELIQRYRQRYQALFPGKRLIGISWRSGNRDSAAMRSLDLPRWKPLFDLEDCAFISLQYGDIRGDLEEMKKQVGDHVYWDKDVNPMGDMDPFSAQIAAMDLVISVDNSTVHFAGGLGKTCWAMLPINTDWRWQMERTDTVWYDNVELIRPDKESGWEGVIDRVAQRVAALDDETLRQNNIRYLKRSLDTMTEAGRTIEAEQYGRMLLAAGEHKAEAMRAVARSALAAGKAEDAMAILRRAAEIDPADARIHADYATAWAQAGGGEEALAYAREATRRFPKSDEASIACGRILTDLDRQDEATDFFARVLRRNPANVESRLSLANLQAAQTHWDLARINYARALQDDPASAAAHMALAQLDLRQHQWQSGWEHFRWRYGARPGTLPRQLAALDEAKQPQRWISGSLRKARVLLIPERNRLEQLVLAGIITDAAKESRKVTLECDPSLLPILQASFPGIDVVARGTLTPEEIDERKIQTWSSLGDLAGRFRADENAFPKRLTVPLTADPTRVAELRSEYRASLPDKFLVGLAWRHGREQDSRSTALADWLPLLDRPEIGVVALFPGNAEAELAAFATESGRDLIHDRRLDFAADLGDYAAQIQACDAVIALEDMAGVLAGATGRPTLKLQRELDHWFWGMPGSANPWFPTLQSLPLAGKPDAALMAQVLDFVAAARDSARMDRKGAKA